MLRKIFYAIQFMNFYFFQLLRANVQLAVITLTPKLNFKYGFIQVPLILKSNFGLLLFSNLVSMTPGSLVTDIDSAKTTATVHLIFFSSEEKLYDEVQSMQKKIKNFTE
jgi:multicomponent Na+:H+ antiporter subunit E